MARRYGCQLCSSLLHHWKRVNLPPPRLSRPSSSTLLARCGTSLVRTLVCASIKTLTRFPGSGMRHRTRGSMPAFAKWSRYDPQTPRRSRCWLPTREPPAVDRPARIDIAHGAGTNCAALSSSMRLLQMGCYVLVQDFAEVIGDWQSGRDVYGETGFFWA